MNKINEEFHFENKINHLNFIFTEIPTFYRLCAYQIGKIIEYIYLQNNYNIKDEIENPFNICKSIVQIYVSSKRLLIELNFFDMRISNKSIIESSEELNITKKSLILNHISFIVNQLANINSLIIIKRNQKRKSEFHEINAKIINLTIKIEQESLFLMHKFFEWTCSTQNSLSEFTTFKKTLLESAYY